MKKLPFSEFILKIIAMVTMTFDHVGLLMVMNSNASVINPDFSNPLFTIGFIFRIIGRIAFPLYIYMIVEGVLHTKHFGKYILRLSIMGVSIMAAQLLVGIFLYDLLTYSAPFMDLILVALMIYFLKRKDKLSILSIIPFGLLVLTFAVQVIERAASITIVWWPDIIRPSYSLFGLLIGLGFYFSHYFAYLASVPKISRKDITEEMVKSTFGYQMYVNIFSSIVLVFVCLLIYGFSFVNVNNTAILMVYSNGFNFANIQTYSVIASVPILLYNGKRGYNKGWFKIFSYLYFPLHIVIIFLIFFVIFK